MSLRDSPAHAVILAGGRGTRFWPRSRARTPKQLLNIVGGATMLQQTVERLAPLFPPSCLWVVTNREQAAAVRRQVPELAPSHLLAEPRGRNTAAAIALAAAHLLRQAGPEARMAILPADHYIARPGPYRHILRASLRVAQNPGALVVLGIPPTRPETGFGYIERATRGTRTLGEPVYPVLRFTEKPSLARARRYLASNRYLWNAGMFFWRVSTFLAALERFLPKTHAALLRLSETIGTPRYPSLLRRTYARLESISVDYAVLEPASRAGSRHPVFVLPAKVGWSDIGSWQAVWELLARHPRDNISTGRLCALDAAGNFLYSPGKLAAAVGVRDLVIVDTPDALLVCRRDRAQDVGRVVKWLEAHRLGELL